MQLPDTEARQHRESRQRSHAERRQLERAQSSWPTSCPGIMLLSRWCITHKEPASAITTRISVKISDTSVQPLLGFGAHVQEEHHMHDHLHGRKTP